MGEEVVEEGKFNLGANLRGFGKFIWSPEKKQLLGRDGMNWAKIGLFYFIFYACLGGFFAGMLAVFMKMTDRTVPTYYGDTSLMASKGLMPGMGFRPQPNVERNLINYKMSVEDGPSGWKILRNSIDRLVHDYDRDETLKAKQVDCSKYNEEDSTEKHQLEPRDYCEFNFDMLQNTECTPENDYGYSRGHPCVFVKLNRIYSWEPKAYENEDEVPAEIKPFWSEEKKNFVYVTCEGENEADQDNIGEIEFFSPFNNGSIGGIPFYYFPYKNQPGYQQPLVFVLFKELTRGVLVNIECRAFAANIHRAQGDRAFQRGSVHFEFLIDNE